MEYDHYIALDWSQRNMAIARMTAKSSQVKCFETGSSVKELKVYLNSLSGKKIMTIEESTGAQFLYTELRDEVDRLIVCDPRRNHLLSEGAKTDKIDSEKLVKLLKADLLKEVFHTADSMIELRTLVSGYEDLVKMGVRAKNQRSALFRARALHHKKDEFQSERESDHFVLERLDRLIALYDEQKKTYEKQFEQLIRKDKRISNLKTLPGIGDIHAVQIMAAVVEPERFPSRGHFLSYCGLVKHNRSSGGRVYEKTMFEYNRNLKKVFRFAAFSSTNMEGSTNPMRKYYEYLINEKKLASHIARHEVARRIATLALGVLKSNRKYEAKRYLEIK